MLSLSEWEACYQTKNFLFSFSIWILIFCVTSVELKGSEMSDISEETKALSEGQNMFTKDLYLALAKRSEGNLFFSPFSISTALAMVYMGSKGNTKQQMESIMHLPEDGAVISNGFQKLISEYKKESKDYELRTSNMAYVSNQLTLVEDFSKVIKDSFLSTLNLVDFFQSEAVRKEINEAVENETNSKIKDLIPAGVLDESTMLVLVNAVYFKGLWVNQFDSANTKPMPFWITADESVDVPMMSIEKEFRIAPKKDLDATLLAMDYKGDQMSFIILLPNKRDGLNELEEKLASVDFASLDRNAAKIKVKVSIPKFKLEQTIDLADLLKSMGITELFDDKACDLSGISEKNDVFVSHAFHKSFLEVNEEGSEAAAATAVIMMTRALIRPQPPFVADHPFLFFIKNKSSNSVLFAGRFLKP